MIDRLVPYYTRDEQNCENCGFDLERLPSAPAVRVVGTSRANAFTADMLGIPEEELPSGLKIKP